MAYWEIADGQRCRGRQPSFAIILSKKPRSPARPCHSHKACHPFQPPRHAAQPRQSRAFTPLCQCRGRGKHICKAKGKRFHALPITENGGENTPCGIKAKDCGKTEESEEANDIGYGGYKHTGGQSRVNIYAIEADGDKNTCYSCDNQIDIIAAASTKPSRVSSNHKPPTRPVMTANTNRSKPTPNSRYTTVRIYRQQFLRRQRLHGDG